jgi:peptidoglycan/LPS O-acetylase OafA/YrhL
MDKTTKQITKQRFIGVELFRGVAAYGVVVIHTEALMRYSSFPTDYWIVAFAEINRFAVPFFLAASFYFMTGKLYANVNHFSGGFNLKSKWKRLLIPYLCWSAIYLCLRLIKALSRPDELGTLFQDPVALIFLGGASVHLYFLPLLFLGSFLITVPEYLVKRQKVNIQTIAFFYVFSMLVYELMIVSGNAFQFGSNCLENASSCSVAFQSLLEVVLPNAKSNQILRLVLVALSWLIQCLPYVFMTMGLNHPSLQTKLSVFEKNHIIVLVFFIILLCAFWILDVFNLIYFPRVLYESGIALCLLVVSIYLSKNVRENWLVKNLGSCSFGIYFMHYLFLVIYIIILSKISNEFLKIPPIFTMVTLATLSFGTSWILTSLLLQKKAVSRLLLGS